MLRWDFGFVLVWMEVRRGAVSLAMTLGLAPSLVISYQEEEQ